MGRISINQSDDWHVQHDRQDIRGWVVQDAEGTRLGHVRDLVADTDSELVETVVLDNGEEYPAGEVHLDYDDRVVYLSDVHARERRAEGATSEPVVKVYDDAGIRQRAEDTAGFARHEPAFREHHRETYAEAEGDYSHYHPAYRLGYDYGAEKEHRDRSWDELKSNIRTDYENRYGEGTWSRVKDAARHAFERARSSTPRGEKRTA